MGKRLHGKKVVVIGGTSGIGFGIAEAALGEGAKVVVASSQQSKVDTALKRLGGQSNGTTIDVKDEADVARFFERLGKFDHLAYTAGDWTPLRTGGTLPEIEIGAANAVFTVRFWGALAAVKHCHRTIAPNGSITITDGMVAHRPRKGAALNTAMAGAVEHLARSLAVDLAPVRVNAVCPGLVLTEVWDSMPADQREERLKAATQRQPLARAGTPAELAEAYLYLMCGTYTTGQVLYVDGGLSLV
ncbi:MAG: SDR family oxidoreductase [Alphaproteobacteria bacterium]|nr:SDR family oxidoreductase [Alphaproteobacteria bacterium]